VHEPGRPLYDELVLTWPEVKALDPEYSRKNTGWKRKSSTDLVDDFKTGGRQKRLAEIFDCDKWAGKGERWDHVNLWDNLNVLLDSATHLDASAKLKVLGVVLDYQLGFIDFRDYNRKMKELAKDNAAFWTNYVLTRKWIDEPTGHHMGQDLYFAYWAFVAKMDSISWQSILKRYGVTGIDLFLLLCRLPPQKAASRIRSDPKLETLLSQTLWRLESDAIRPTVPYLPEIQGIEVFFNLDQEEPPQQPEEE